MSRGNIDRIAEFLATPEAAGMSNRAVAKRLGCGQTAVAKVRKRMGLARPASNAAGYSDGSTEDEAAAADAADAGRPEGDGFDVGNAVPALAEQHNRALMAKRAVEPAQGPADGPEDDPVDLDPDDRDDALRKIVAAHNELEAARADFKELTEDRKAAGRRVKAAEKKLLRYTGGAGEVYPLFDQPGREARDNGPSAADLYEPDPVAAQIAHHERAASGRPKRSRRASSAKAGRPNAEASV
jgi:hypothetical protein